jgi:hypothetical protein
MERMRGMKVFVFVDATAVTKRQFVGTVEIRRLRWALAQRYPWLEVAYVKALDQAYPKEDARSPAVQSITSDNGALVPSRALQLVQSFVLSLQPQAGAAPAPGALQPQAAHSPGDDEDEWVTFDKGERERAAWVTRWLLSELFEEHTDFGSRVEVQQDMSPGRRSRAVLRCKMAFVPLVDERGQFLRLVNRHAYLESLAAETGQEPE